MRYAKVKAEFDRLGLEAFSTKYLTPQIKDRLRVALDQVERRVVPPKPRPLGVNPRAIKYAGEKHSGRTRIGGPDKHVWNRVLSRNRPAAVIGT